MRPPAIRLPATNSSRHQRAIKKAAFHQCQRGMRPFFYVLYNSNRPICFSDLRGQNPRSRFAACFAARFSALSHAPRAARHHHHPHAVRRLPAVPRAVAAQAGFQVPACFQAQAAARAFAAAVCVCGAGRSTGAGPILMCRLRLTRLWRRAILRHRMIHRSL